MDKTMRESALNKTGETSSESEASSYDASCGDHAPENQTATYVCIKCGRSFPKPLMLTLHTKGAVETYDACPHCFSKINTSSKANEDKASEDLKALAKKMEKTTPLRCTHSLGYLRTHSKGTPYPDECLSCAAIMECLTGRTPEAREEE